LEPAKEDLSPPPPALPPVKSVKPAQPAANVSKKAPSQSGPISSSPHLIAQALANLLIEKGLITGDELTQQLEDLWVREMEKKA